MKIILFILLIIVIIIIILLLLPIKLKFDYDNELNECKVKYLFFTYDLIQEDEEEEDEVKTKKKDKTKSKEKKPKKKKSVVDVIKNVASLIIQLYQPGKKTLKRIFRGLKIRKLFIDIDVFEDDAYDSAIKFGQMNILVYNLVAITSTIVDVEKEKINIHCQFNESEESYIIRFFVKIRAGALIHALLGLIISYIKITIKQNSRNGGKNERPAHN